MWVCAEDVGQGLLRLAAITWRQTRFVIIGREERVEFASDKIAKAIVQPASGRSAGLFKTVFRDGEITE
jgi:hypothetical protein